MRYDRPVAPGRTLTSLVWAAAVGILLQAVSAGQFISGLTNALGVHDNPGHAATFGDDPQRRRRCLRRMFTAVIEAGVAQQRICAVDGGAIVGVAAMAAPGRCRPSVWQKTRIAASLAPLGAAALARVVAWQRCGALTIPTSRTRTSDPWQWMYTFRAAASARC